jgi:hypothetical protein
MILRSLLLAPLVLLSGSVLFAAEPAEWVGQWNKFTAPPVRGFFMITTPAPPRLERVLAGLPEPARWGEVEVAFAAAEAGSAGDFSRRRLRLGRWLVMEMSGRGEAVAAELAAAVEAKEIEADTARDLLGALGRDD